MKNGLVTASTVLFLLLSAMPIYAVGAQNVELLSEGDTFTYERYHVLISNDPAAASEFGEDFFTRNNSIVTVKIDNVSTTTVSVQISIRYQNGTQSTISLIRDIVAGYNKPANTTVGFGNSEAGALDLIQKPQKQVDYIETRKYGEIIREVNVFSTEEHGWTMFYNTVHNDTTTRKFYYDAQTGMFLESESETFIYNRNNPNLNQTIHYFFILKDTNVWVAPKPPSVPDSPSIPLLPLLMIATATVVVVVVVVYLKKRKTSG